MVYDFGKIKQNVPVNHDFIFTNISTDPIVIESAVASCGCTTPVKPEGAVPKGKENKINAGFNAANPGPFNKTITVKVAGVDAPVQLRITGKRSGEPIPSMKRKNEPNLKINKFLPAVGRLLKIHQVSFPIFI